MSLMYARLLYSCLGECFVCIFVIVQENRYFGIVPLSPALDPANLPVDRIHLAVLWVDLCAIVSEGCLSVSPANSMMEDERGVDL